MRAPRIFPALALFISVTAVHAADPAPPPLWPVAEMKALLTMPEPTPEARAATARLIKDLTADDFPTRDRASKELAAKGPEAFPGLREAVMASADPELIARTAAALDRRIKVPPNTPKQVADLVHQYEQSRASLLKNLKANPQPQGTRAVRVGESSGSWDMPEYLFLQIVLPQETDPAAHAFLLQSLMQQAGTRARLAIAEGNLDDAEQILRDSLDILFIPQDFVALRALRQGEALNPDQELARLALQGPKRNLIAAALYRAKGDTQRAAALANGNFNEDWLPARSMLVEARRYDLIAKQGGPQPIRGANDLDNIIAYSLMGEANQARDMLDAVLRPLPWTPDVSLPDILIKFDRAEEAIAACRKTNDSGFLAFHLLCAQLRVREALATIKDRKNAPFDLPEHFITIGLPGAARGLLRDMRPDEPRLDLAAGMSQRSYFRFAALLAMAGQPQEAAQWRDRGLSLVEAWDAQRRQLTAKLDRDREALRSLNPNAPADARAALQLAIVDATARLASYRYAPNIIQFSGDPDLADNSAVQAASFWYGLIASRGTGPRACYEQAVRIVQGTLPDAAITDLEDQVARQTDLGTLIAAVTSFHCSRRDDLALDLTRRWFAQQQDPSCWAMAGDIELENGHASVAASYYLRAAPYNLVSAPLMWRTGWALSKSPETRAQGAQLMAYAPMLVLGDRGRAIYLADTMRRFQGAAAADAWFAAYTRRYSSMDLAALGDSLLIARDAAEARGDFAEALELQKQMRFSLPLQPLQGKRSITWPVVHMASVADYHRLRALDALMRKDFPTLADALDRHLNNAAPDVELLEKTLPALRTANPDAAQKILARAIDRLTPIVQDYPEATQYQTQLTRLHALAK